MVQKYLMARMLKNFNGVEDILSLRRDKYTVHHWGYWQAGVELWVSLQWQPLCHAWLHASVVKLDDNCDLAGW